MNETQKDKEDDFWKGHNRCMAKELGGTTVSNEVSAYKESFALPPRLSSQFIPYKPTPELPWYEAIKPRKVSILV